jgi:hypothetical protein
MAGPELFNSCDREQSGTDAPGAPYLETISLLQDEIARLEQELDLLHGGQTEPSAADLASSESDDAAAGRAEPAASGASEVEGLKSELADRDATIRMLLDELSRVEAAQEATRAEWEHLAAWVDELERRVETQDGESLHEIQRRLEVQEQKAEAIKTKSERDRRDWESQRQIYQTEIARLNAALEQTLNTAGALVGHDCQVETEQGQGALVVEALQAENLRLRAAWQELVERTAANDRSDSLEAKLAEAEQDRQQVLRQVGQLEDQAKRDRLEHQATVAELEARLSQASASLAQGSSLEARPAGISPSLEVELRIQALRRHLVESDEREKEERREKRLVTRLSRLWSRTGPR